MTRFLAFVATALGVTAFVLLQASFFPALGALFRFVDIPIFAALFSATIFERRIAFALFGAITIMQGLLSSQFFLLPLLINLCVCLLLAILHERFFTNRTYYSVTALASSGWLLYLLLTFALTIGWQTLTGEAMGIRLPNVASLVVALLALQVSLLFFYAMTVLFSKRIRSYFILSNSRV